MSAKTVPEPTEGWARALRSELSHYFRAGRSLCRKFWTAAGPLEARATRPNIDCAACARDAGKKPRKAKA